MARLSTFRRREDTDYVSLLNAPLQLAGDFLFRRPLLEEYLRSRGAWVGRRGVWGTVVLMGRNGKADELNVGGTLTRVYTEEEFWQTFFWVGDRVGDRYVPDGFSISRRNHLFCAAPPLARLVVHGHVGWEVGKACGHRLIMSEFDLERVLPSRWRTVLRESRSVEEGRDASKLAQDWELECLLDVV